MNISRLSLTALLLGALLLPGSVFAQTPPVPATGKAVVVATVNIYKARIIAQKGNSFDLSFDITNRDGIQPNVKYSAFLVQKTPTGQGVYGEQVYDETLTLGANSTVHKTITYTAPAQLSGVYELWLASKNTDGFPFAAVYVDKIRLKPTEGGSVTIDPSSCFLTVTGDAAKTHYTLVQGVDIAATETLEATCVAQNTTDAALTLLPSFVTHLRSQYGAVVEAVGGGTSPVTVSAKESKEFTVLLPKAAIPQAYDILFTLTDAANKQNTNSVTFHYVLQGASATVQNVHWDKEVYQSGDTAVVSFMWSPSADNFANARVGKGTALVSPIAELSVTDEKGASCGAPITQDLAQTSAGLLGEVQFSITQTCAHPQISALIKDSSHGTLAEGHFSTIPLSPLVVPPAGSSSTMIIIMLIVMGAIIAVAVNVMRKSSTNTNPPPSVPGVMLLLMMVAFGMFGGAPSAHADTWYAVSPVSGDPYTTMYTTSLDSSTYLPGQAMIISWSMSAVYCWNETRDQTLVFNVDGSTVTTAFNASLTGHDFVGSSNIVAAPMNPGPYTVNFTGTMGAAYHGGDLLSWVPTVIANYSMPFTVVASQPIPPPVVTVRQSPGSIIVSAQTGTVTWSATNNPDSCTVRQDGAYFFFASGAGGSVPTDPIYDDTTTTFTVECTNAGGSGFGSVSFTVRGPVVTITPKPSAIIPSGTPASVTWSVVWPAPNTPRSCTIEDLQTNVVTPLGTSGGTQPVGSLTTNKSFRVRCVDSGWGHGEAATYFTITGSLLPILSVDPRSLDFGTVAVTDTKDKTITMTNTGGSVLNVEGITSSPHFTCISGCVATLSAGGHLSQVATIRLTAPSTTGAPSETITVNSSNATNGDQDVRVFAAIVPVITINPGPLDFGDVTVKRFKDLPLTINNNSNTITVPKGNISVTAPFSCASSCTYLAIPPKGSAQVMIRYSPPVVTTVPDMGIGTLSTGIQNNTGILTGNGVPLSFKFIEK